MRFSESSKRHASTLAPQMLNYRFGYLWSVYLAFITLLGGAAGWHDTSNSEFHCWKLAASAADPTNFPSCPGVDFAWLKPPPDEIKAEVHFNVTFELILDNNVFWSWAVGNNIFQNAGPGGTGFTNATDARNWCTNTTCPADYNNADQTNCCIHHVNVHSCPLDETSYCGPWIPASGDLFTHSQVLIGPLATTNWTSYVAGLYKVGSTQVIAHFKLAGMHLALHKNIQVFPKTVCGDANCETDSGETCSTCPADCGTCPLGAWQIALIVLFGVLIVLVLIGVFVYFQYKSRKMLYDEGWIIPFEEVREDMGMRGFMGSVISVNAASMSDVQSGNLGYDNALQQQAAQKQKFTQTGIFMGKTVAVKRIQKEKFQLTTSVRREVKQVRELDHQCLNRFIGACLEVDNFSILMEYCPKGSLNDVLLNEDVPLNWGFRFSFANDIARGMNNLHQRRIYHGRLTSSNCIIDDRWTVKITDFGLPSLRTADTEDEDDLEIKEQKLRVYLAPEMEHEGLRAKATGPGDVYSYSIILVEIATRNDPYGDELADTSVPGWRPRLPDYEDDPENPCPCPQKYNQLITSCWAEKPSERPTFEHIKRTISKINPNKLSPVDLMMQMMEKYSKHLESLVAERTADLVLEKQKTDRLLYSMMPKAVADQLRQGKPIQAEWFNECTIYFSDIVGFTTLSGKSTPHEVVGLLNKLYTTFDSIIDKYHVYKVETIGDAYMVVSGVPDKIGTRHASEIARMAMDLVESCETFVIPHLPDEALRIRVGLHSGPVCAGVVGLKMPRYCLFGDTVNTASRMESNGEAYKIHLSETTHLVLTMTGGFLFEKRGTIPVKGKGEMTTYWLKGLDQTFNFKDVQATDRKISSSNDSGYNDKHPDERELPDLFEQDTEVKVDLPGTVAEETKT